MSGIHKALLNFDGKQLFSVKQSGSFTIPDAVAVSSIIGDYSGLNATTVNLDTMRPTVGGALFLGFNDATSGAFSAGDNRICSADLSPGDVVACSAVASSLITVTVTDRDGNVKSTFRVTATAVGGVLGYYA